MKVAGSKTAADTSCTKNKQRKVERRASRPSTRSRARTPGSPLTQRVFDIQKVNYEIESHSTRCRIVSHHLHRSGLRRQQGNHRTANPGRTITAPDDADETIL